MKPTFMSEDWDAVKEEIASLIASEQRALELTDNEKNADKSRGALRVLRHLQDLPKRVKNRSE